MVYTCSGIPFHSFHDQNSIIASLACNDSLDFVEIYPPSLSPSESMTNIIIASYIGSSKSQGSWSAIYGIPFSPSGWALNFLVYNNNYVL